MTSGDTDSSFTHGEYNYYNSITSKYPTANRKEFVNSYHGIQTGGYVETLEKTLKHYQYKHTAGMYPIKDTKELVLGSFEEQKDEKVQKQRHITFGSSEYMETPKFTGKALKQGHISWSDGIQHYNYDSKTSKYPNANSKEHVKSYHGNSDVKTPKLIGKVLEEGHICQEAGAPHYHYIVGMHPNWESKGFVNSYHGSSEDPYEREASFP